MKRILSLLLALSLVLTFIPTGSVQAAGAEVKTDAVLQVSDVYATAGGSVAVDITLKNNPGIIGMTLKVTYDESKATLTSVENGDTLSYMTFTTPKNLRSGCQLPWAAEYVLDEDIQDGVIATLTFAVNQDAGVNESIGISISYDSGAIIDNDLNPLSVEIVDGSIMVLDYTPGDLNGDGVVNTTDAVMLMRYIAGGYSITINEAAADVNDDGKINTTDVVYITRYTAGGYGIVLKPSTPKCSHTMEAIAYKAPTCTESGNASYYHCTTCGKYYNDAAGSQEITLESTVIAAKGHTAVTDPYVAPTYESTGLTEGSHCSTCGLILVAQQEIPKLEKDEYAITYYIDLNDTYLQTLDINNPNPSAYTAQDGLTLSKDVFVDGYVYEGWYDGQGASANEVKEIPAGTTGNITLYAKWTKVTYTITFHSPLAETTEKTYTVDTGATLTNPSYYGYTFVGWSDDDGNLITRVRPGSIGNITLTANWTSKRNQTIPVSSLDKPVIVEDKENGMLFFTYYIGRMENIPLYTIKDFGYNSGNGITWSETVTTTYSISEENATSIANSIAEATTDTSSWTLSQGWNTLTSISETQSVSRTQEQQAAYENSVSKTGSFSIGNSVGGAKSTTTETGVSSKVSSTASAKITASKELSVEAAGVKADVGVELEGGYSHTTEEGKTYSHVSESSKNWSSSSSFESSKTASASASISASLSSTVSQETGIGHSYGSTEDFEKSNSVSTSQSKETEYGSTFVYAKDTTTTTTKTYTNEGSTEGYYRLVAAGKVHVFAVVGYDIASSSYFIYTYNVMDDETYEFMDYSATTSSYDDLQNGILPFEVPYEVNTYVDNLTLKTMGLSVDIDTGMITGYTGTADRVMIPKYMTVDNRDDSKTVVYIQGIAPNAFAGNTSIVEVKFPDSITAIPDGAFKGCTSLTGIVASNITSIGAEAFSGCTALESYTVSGTVTSLGANAFRDVASVSVTAYNAAVARAGAASGAKSITLNLGSMVDTLSNETFEIPEGTEYFAFNGYTGVYSGVRILSNASNTVINGATFTDCQDMPLVISSENVTLNRVTVTSSGLAMQLTAPTTNVALYSSVYMTSSGQTAIQSNSVVLSLSDTAVASRMYVHGNMLVCGSVTNESYLTFTNGKLICYNAEETCVVTFDANGGTCNESTRIVNCGSAIGELPAATNAGYVFYGWADADGNIITEDTICYAAGEMTLYARWIEPYTVTWNAGVGYTITVTRTESPTGGAATGALASGDSIYPDDVLTISYAATTGYSLGSCGATKITVTGNVTSEQIYAKATANSYTYNIKYVSTNGTSLGTATVTYKYGTTNTITPPAKSGYTTPGSQTVTWDSTTAKTITFKYSVKSVDSTTKSGYISNSTNYKLAYKAVIEHQNRTATSVQIRVTWTATLSGTGAYNAYAQWFKASVGSVSTGNVKVVSQGTWSSASSSARSGTASSGWITVPLSTTNATSVNLSVYYYQANYNGTDMSSSGTDNLSTTWSIAVPAY